MYLPRKGKNEEDPTIEEIDVDPSNPYSFCLQLHQEPLISPASALAFLYPR